MSQSAFFARQAPSGKPRTSLNPAHGRPPHASPRRKENKSAPWWCKVCRRGRFPLAAFMSVRAFTVRPRVSVIEASLASLYHQPFFYATVYTTYFLFGPCEAESGQCTPPPHIRPCICLAGTGRRCIPSGPLAALGLPCQCVRNVFRVCHTAQV